MSASVRAVWALVRECMPPGVEAITPQRDHIRPSSPCDQGVFGVRLAVHGPVTRVGPDPPSPPPARAPGTLRDGPARGPYVHFTIRPDVPDRDAEGPTSAHRRLSTFARVNDRLTRARTEGHRRTVSNEIVSWPPRRRELASPSQNADPRGWFVKAARARTSVAARCEPEDSKMLEAESSSEQPRKSDVPGTSRYMTCRPMQIVSVATAFPVPD